MICYSCHQLKPLKYLSLIITGLVTFTDTTLLSAENAPKDYYSASKIGQFNPLEIKIESIDVFPYSTPVHLQTLLSSRSSSTTAGLSLLLNLKRGVRIMITLNIDLADCLINGQFGVVLDFVYTDSSITKFYVKLDDENAGKNAILKDLYPSKYKIVPTQRIEANIIISKTFFRNIQKKKNFHWKFKALLYLIQLLLH